MNEVRELSEARERQTLLVSHHSIFCLFLSAFSIDLLDFEHVLFSMIVLGGVHCTTT
jgi:hypothetical protein